MTDQASTLRGLMEHRPEQVDETAPQSPKARTIAVTSGKGGVGKTSIALNLAVELANSGYRVCLLDAVMGLGNIDLLCGLNGYWNLSHVITGARALRDIVLQGPCGVNVIPGASGLAEVADCPEPAQEDILRQLQQLEHQHDFLVIDTGTGIHRLVRQFAAIADLVLVVTTTEPTSIADAYATVKSLGSHRPLNMEVLVNQAESLQQARAICERIQRTSKLFLESDVQFAGSIPSDPEVVRAVFQKQPFTITESNSPASIAIRQLASRIQSHHTNQQAGGEFFTRLWNSLATHAKAA